MSSNLKGAELNYHEVDKQDFVLFKAVKHFQPYLLKSKTKIIVPFSAVTKFVSSERSWRKKSTLDGFFAGV